MKSSLKIAVLLALVVTVYAKPASSKENTSTNVCQGEKDGTKFPDMKNCNKYIKCDKSKETSKSCESGKSFDAVSLTCVKSSDAVCFQVPAPTTTTTKKPTTTTTKRTTTKKPTTTTELPIVEDPIPECFSVNEADCGMYYDCDGEAHWENCLEGYIYYPKLHSCLPGNVATCELYTLN